LEPSYCRDELFWAKCITYLERNELTGVWKIRMINSSGGAYTNRFVFQSKVKVKAHQVRDLLEFLASENQSCHVNGGTHGDSDGSHANAPGILSSVDYAEGIFIKEDIDTIQALKTGCSYHTVTSYDPPRYSPNARCIINAWCFSDNLDEVQPGQPEFEEINIDSELGWKIDDTLVDELRGWFAGFRWKWYLRSNGRYHTLYFKNGDGVHWMIKDSKVFNLSAFDDGTAGAWHFNKFISPRDGGWNAWVIAEDGIMFAHCKTREDALKRTMGQHGPFRWTHDTLKLKSTFLFRECNHLKEFRNVYKDVGHWSLVGNGGERHELKWNAKEGAGYHKIKGNTFFAGDRDSAGVKGEWHRRKFICPNPWHHRHQYFAFVIGERGMRFACVRNKEEAIQSNPGFNPICVWDYETIMLRDLFRQNVFNH